MKMLASIISYSMLINMLIGTLVGAEEDLWQSKCASHIKFYLETLTGQQPLNPGDIWPWRMVDAAGRFPPDGFLSTASFAVPGSESGCLNALGKYPSSDGVEEVGNRLCTFSIFKGKQRDPFFGEEQARMIGRPTKIESGEMFGGDQGSAFLEALVAGINQAVCVPESCSIEQVEDILTYFVQSIPGQNQSEPVWNAATVGCTKGGLEQLGVGDYIMISVCCLLGLMCLVGTIYSWILAFSNGKAEGMLGTFLLGFSVPDNLSKLFAPERKDKNHITCLNGIRVLSMMWIVYGHCFVFGIFSVYNDGLSGVLGYITSFPFRLLLNAWPSVDNFFFMSGLLVGYLTLKELERNHGRLNILMFYIHRYLRLVGLYGFVVGLHATFLGWLENGHISWIRRDHEKCVRYWWRNLLYIQNLLDDPVKCVDVSWYLDNDMQMFLVSPLLFFPMYKLAKGGKDHMSLLFASMWMVAFTVLVGALTYINEWPLSSTVAMQGEEAANFQNDYYIQAYCRCLPYIMGITTGFVLHRLQGKEVKLSPLVVISMWIMSAFIIFTTIFAIDSGPVMFYGASAPGMVVDIYFNSVGKVLYGAALGWIVFACVKGYGGYVNDFLSWEGFTVLGRLSFSIYLVHQSMIGIVSSRIAFFTPLSLSFITVYFIGIFNGCLLLSLLLALFVEMPFLTAEKMLFNIIGGRKRT